MKIYVVTIKTGLCDIENFYVLGAYSSEEKANEAVNKWVNSRGYSRELWGERFYLYDGNNEMSFQISIENTNLDDEPRYD